MLKSIAVVSGSYLLSVVLVMTTTRCYRSSSLVTSSKTMSPPTSLSSRARFSSSWSRSSARGSAPALLRAVRHGMCSGSSSSGN